ncbi:NAD(P)-dependent oxidoreductase [Emcibacter sp. SYSU 3D8]|uniref:NAD(P)-dependent oxidoreductase n=1 Tax=Emcibacter sp. SYSU 3D8 TaxID=3133969 RepID=UPI0031FE8114
MIALVGVPRAAGLNAGIEGALRALGLGCVRHDVARMGEIADLSGVEILLSTGVRCGAAEMDRMPRLRAVVSPVLGYDWIDAGEASRRGIAVCNTEAAENREGMAESTIMLLLALLYRLQDTEALLRTNADGDPLKRHILKGRTVGIIGYGGITREVIARLAAWGCHFLVHSRSATEPVPGVTFVPLDDLLGQSDAILVLTSLNPSTRHMLGSEQFAKVRPGTLLVNTARGAIIDEAALVEALKSGRLGAAAIDVFEKEPCPPDHPLRDLPNVILTPHAIGHNEEAKEAGPALTAQVLKTLAEGGLPDSCKNRDAVKG